VHYPLANLECFWFLTQAIIYLVAFGASLQCTLDFSKSCNKLLFYVFDENVVVFKWFVIQTSEYDINRGTNFSSEYKVIRGIAGCFVSGALVRYHGKRQTNVPVFLEKNFFCKKFCIFYLQKPSYSPLSINFFIYFRPQGSVINKGQKTDR